MNVDTASIASSFNSPWISAASENARTTYQHKFSRFVHDSFMCDKGFNNIMDSPETHGFTIGTQLLDKMMLFM